MTTFFLSSKDHRRFFRRLRASDQKGYLKTGCDSGLYDHFKGPVATPKLRGLLEKVVRDFKDKEQG